MSIFDELREKFLMKSQLPAKLVAIQDPILGGSATMKPLKTLFATFHLPLEPVEAGEEARNTEVS